MLIILAGSDELDSPAIAAFAASPAAGGALEEAAGNGNYVLCKT